MVIVLSRLFEEPPQFDFSVISATPLLSNKDSSEGSPKPSGESHKEGSPRLSENVELNGTATTIRLATTCGWYPPLVRLSECLSGIQQVVVPSAFQILAQVKLSLY